MDYIGYIGLVSAVISIPAIFLPDKWRSKKITFTLFIVLTAFMAGIIVNQNSKLKRIGKISNAVNKLIDNREMEYTDRAFIQASLAFMEQNKDLYPDSYSRAIKVAQYLNSNNSSGTIVSSANELEGLLKGIALLND